MSARERNILVVDDDDTSRHTLAFVLERAGYLVHQARDGAEALQRLQQPGPFGAILADDGMPHVDGLRLLSICRLIWPHIPLVLCSQEAERLAVLAQEAGAFACLTKPYDWPRVLATVRAAVSTTTPAESAAGAAPRR